MKEQLMELLPSVFQQKKLIVHFLLLLVGIFVVSTLTSHLAISYHEKAQKETQMAQMQSYLKDWQAKSDKLNHATMRPVEEKQADGAQTELIFHIQSSKLNMLSMKGNQKKETDGKSYTVEFAGTYEDTMRCLQNFHARDALIGIQHCKINMQGGQLHTSLTYKIYTK